MSELRQGNRYGISDLLRIMARLRDPENGCPWDLRQDFASIVPSTLEECYELAAAIEAEDWPHVEDELGDLLFQVVFYAQLGRERRLFDFDGVVDALADKLLRRHPHVFGSDAERAAGPAEGSWERIKAAERSDKDEEGALAGVHADLVLLCSFGLSSLGRDYAEKYWQEMVTTTGATAVVPMHFDDFTRPFGEVVPFPKVLDDIEKVARWFESFRDTWDTEVLLYKPEFGRPIAIQMPAPSST